MPAYESGQKKFVAVIGATGGIGQAVVQKFVGEAWRVAACARHRSPTNGPTVPATALNIEIDVGDDFSVRCAITEISQIEPEIDALIYCVGDIQLTKVAELETHDWNRILTANLTGAYQVARAGMPLLKDTGSFIVVGAQSERLRLPGMAAYAAAKAGLEAFIATLAKEERTRRITLVRPGAVASPFWDKIPLRLPKNALQPSAVADRIWAIVRDGETGVVDV